jgi:alpha-glucosidase
LICILACTQAASGHWEHLGPVTSHELDGAVLALQCGEASLRVEAVNNHVVRVRLAPTGRFGRDFSWAVPDTAPKGRFGAFDEDAATLRLSTGGLRLSIQRDPCRLQVLDVEGNVLVADEPTRGLGWRTGPAPNAVRVWQQLPDETAIYGLGEKTGPLNKRGRAWTMWNSDTPAYGDATDPLYKSIPFFICANEGRYHGVFFDNPWRTNFDFGQRERGVLSFGAEGGELNYYVIAGPEPKGVIRRYTDLTGRMELPPKWALGYHQCRYSYYPESRVREIASTFRDKQIPCDVIYFDIDYMDGYRCFTWDADRFPDPRGLMDDLHRDGFHTVAIIDPGIKEEEGYFVYDQGTALGAWLTKPDGEPYVGRVWPGPTVWPDFTNHKVRDWWAGLYPQFIGACGLDGIWNDMNEPADFAGPNKTVPLDLRHDNEAEPTSHRAAHNVYGMQMVRATYEGLKRARPDQRPFAITRATYAGGQRYGAVWTGDNISSWDHLRMSLTMVMGLGVSGVPFSGPDIGGFVAGATPELYARWIQAGSLLPFCRTHTAKGNPDQEPWSYGPEVEEASRRALERRYELLPYIYTVFEEASRTGLPTVRPLWLEYPNENRWWMEHVFFLGSDVYVVPILWPDARDFTHWLPEGVWFDANTDLVHGSGQPVKIDADPGNLPHFVRAGAIIPMQSPVQSTTHTPDEPLILDVWPFGESAGELYEDDGETLAYQRGEFRRTQLYCVAHGGGIGLFTRVAEGGYSPPARTPLARLHGLAGRIKKVTCLMADGSATVTRHEPSDDRALPSPGDFRYDGDSGTWLVRMQPDNGQAQGLRVDLAPLPPASDGDASVDFSDAEESLLHHHGIRKVQCSGGLTRIEIEEPWDPNVVLRRFRFRAEDRPVLKVRLATQNTTKLGIRFATEEDPLLSNREQLVMALTNDGELHDYSFDLAGEQDLWTGTVYWVRLDFEDGVRVGETISLDHLAFEERP